MIWFLLFSAIAHYSILNHEIDRKEYKQAKTESSSKARGTNRQDRSPELVPKEQDQTVIKVRLKKPGTTQTKKKSKTCLGKTYIGIGVNLIGYSGRIIKVSPGYGAHKAGLREGDYIESFTYQGFTYHSLFDINALVKENDQIEVTYTRNGIIYKVLIRVEKICTRK